MAPVQTGDHLIIPLPVDDITQEKRIAVNWTQNFKDNAADYYTIIATNKTKDGIPVVVFIQSEYYTDEKLAEYGLKTDEGFEIVVADKLRYGQRGGASEGRFVVLQDLSRDMYETRFIDAVLGSPVPGLVEQVNKAQGVVPVDVKVKAGIIGCGGSPDYLKTFK